MRNTWTEKDVEACAELYRRLVISDGKERLPSFDETWLVRYGEDALIGVVRENKDWVNYEVDFHEADTVYTAPVKIDSFLHPLYTEGELLRIILSGKGSRFTIENDEDDWMRKHCGIFSASAHPDLNKPGFSVNSDNIKFALLRLALEVVGKK